MFGSPYEVFPLGLPRLYASDVSTESSKALASSGWLVHRIGSEVESDVGIFGFVVRIVRFVYLSSSSAVAADS